MSCLRRFLRKSHQRRCVRSAIPSPRHVLCLSCCFASARLACIRHARADSKDTGMRLIFCALSTHRSRKSPRLSPLAHTCPHPSLPLPSWTCVCATRAQPRRTVNVESHPPICDKSMAAFPLRSNIIPFPHSKCNYYARRCSCLFCTIDTCPSV